MQTVPSMAPVLTPLPATDFVANDFGEMACDGIKRLAAVFALETVAQTSDETLRNVGGMCLDSSLGVLSVVGGAFAFKNCLNDSFISLDGAMFIACGLNAVACLDLIFDAAIKLGIGIGNYSVLTGGFVTTVKLVASLSQGDTVAAALSGAKLVTALALTGHPVVLGAVISVDLAYNYSHWVLPAAALSILSSPNATDGHLVPANG